VLCHSFIRAKEIARRAYCLNNLKQISTLANLYNIDRGAAPYTQNWLVDFTFCSDYLQDFRVLECPSMDDRVRTQTDLNGNTSYHYMGSRQDWLRNNAANGDGTEYGFDASNSAIRNLLSNREEKLVYDRTDDVHYGIFNVVYVESSSADSFPRGEASKFWFVAESGSLNFPEGTAVASASSSAGVTVASTVAGSGSGSTTTVASSGGTTSTSTSGSDGSGTAATGSTGSTTTVASSGGTGSSTDATGSTGSGSSSSTTSTTTVASTTTSGHTNNGHGNNEDGVDVSNPGNSKEGEDTDPTVDDESKGGKKK